MAAKKKSSIDSQDIDSFASYMKWVEDADLLHKIVLYRGQPVQGELLPGIARKDRTRDTTNLEREVLEQFKLRGASLLRDIEKNSLELLVIAQHFGLKTRLLDWTSNPLAALYFACADQEKGDVFVYALNADSLLSTEASASDPFEAPKTRVFQPAWNNPRIVAQQGWFTLHRHSVRSQKFIALERNTDTKRHLTERRIPAALRGPMLKSLAKLAVGPQTLMPDLTGLTRSLNETHRLA